MELEKYLEGVIINDNYIEDVEKHIIFFGGKISYLDKYKEVLIKDIYCIEYDII